MRVLFWLTCFGRFEDVLFIVKVKSLSRFQLFATLWTVVYQAPLSMRFSRQEYWSGLPFPSPMHESEVARVRLLATPWTAAHQAPPSMGFSRQECWSGLPLSVCLKCGRPRFYPWVGKIPGEGHGNPLQYSCLENLMDRGAWGAMPVGSQRVRHD